MSYIAIEGIKDGCFFSAKYEAGMCVYNPPHVMVFANKAPELTMLSSDRWVVKCLDKPKDYQIFDWVPRGGRVDTSWKKKKSKDWHYGEDNQ